MELGDQVLHRGVVVEGLLELDQLRGSCQVVLVVWHGCILFAWGLSHGSVPGTVRLQVGWDITLKEDLTNHLEHGYHRRYVE